MKTNRHACVGSPRTLFSQGCFLSKKPTHDFSLGLLSSFICAGSEQAVRSGSLVQRIWTSSQSCQGYLNYILSSFLSIYLFTITAFTKTCLYTFYLRFSAAFLQIDLLFSWKTHSMFTIWRIILVHLLRNAQPKENRFWKKYKNNLTFLIRRSTCSLGWETMPRIF